MAHKATKKNLWPIPDPAIPAAGITFWLASYSQVRFMLKTGKTALKVRFL